MQEYYISRRHAWFDCIYQKLILSSHFYLNQQFCIEVQWAEAATMQW